jgi:hypothetical protein
LANVEATTGAVYGGVVVVVEEELLLLLFEHDILEQAKQMALTHINFFMVII